MGVFRKINDWLKYERLEHYPPLKAFDRAEALKRLRAYEREERAACQPWLTVGWVLIVVSACGIFFLSFHLKGPLYSLVQVPAWLLQYMFYRRIRRRVEAKVAAELGDGRYWTCYECGYDLRASESRCPECGASVRAGPPET
jgi:hypothetical protein